ncbi:MlaD family protein [Terasakiella pusilla]|uniref:MlaD family protein n=1 Tax=Terasakiella pusilla TaxID=64973 RepID=UPI00146FAAF5|nr:MlaD family protein [Terasakiella pusilla]
MYSSRREKIVGGLTFSGLILAIFLSYGQPETDLNDDGSYKIEATFSRVDGLDEDAEVRMGGVPIGQVIGARLNDNYRAVVTMRISPDVGLPVDTSAAIHTDGLFGTKFIELEPGGDEVMMTNGSVIDMTQSSVIVEELLELIISQGKSKRADAAQ